MVDRLSQTSQNELINIITIFLGVTVGATAKAENFLTPDTLKIIALGLLAFGLVRQEASYLGKLCVRYQAARLIP